MGQACIGAFDCFRQPLAPFTIKRVGKNNKGKLQSFFGTLCGMTVSVCIIAILALAAMPKIDLILSGKPLSWYQIETEIDEPIQIDTSALRFGFTNKDGAIVPVNQYAGIYGHFFIVTNGDRLYECDGGDWMCIEMPEQDENISHQVSFFLKNPCSVSNTAGCKSIQEIEEWQEEMSKTIQYR